MGRDPAPESPTVVTRPAGAWAPSHLPGWGEPGPLTTPDEDDDPDTTVFPKAAPDGGGRFDSPTERFGRSAAGAADPFGRAQSAARAEPAPPDPGESPWSRSAPTSSSYRGGPAPGSTMAGMAAAAGLRRQPARSGNVGARPMPRRARLTLKKIDPWSVLKVTFVYALALYVVILVAIAVLYGVLAGMGVFHSLNSFLSTVGASGKVSAYLGFGRIFLYALVIGAVNVVLFTALSTLGAFIYNVCGDLVGGLELTLTETE